MINDIPSFKELLQTVTSAKRVELEERAAIKEFEGGIPRAEAEIQTVKEHCKANAGDVLRL
jgi:hypothetical protein